MIDKLIKLLDNSISEKSKFKVAAIIVDTNGTEYNGVNVEYQIPTNSSCAERTAILSAIANGLKLGEVKEVHILASKHDGSEPERFTPPCGLCRQAILEASKGEAQVYLYNLNKEVKQYSITELLPEAFTGV